MSDCRQKHEKAQREYWADDCPYGDYLIEVDDHLMKLIGRGSTQAEMAYIADLQEYSLTPREAAREIALNTFYCIFPNSAR